MNTNLTRYVQATIACLRARQAGRREAENRHLAILDEVWDVMNDAEMAVARVITRAIGQDQVELDQLESVFSPATTAASAILQYTFHMKDKMVVRGEPVVFYTGGGLSVSQDAIPRRNRLEATQI